MNGNNQDADSAAAVVYFDATVRRKEKMRLASAQGSTTSSHLGDSAVHPVPSPEVATSSLPSTARPVAPTQPVAPPAATPILPSNSESKSASNGSSQSAPTSSSASSSNGLTSDSLTSFLVNFVVEQTGYPPEIVEMDADLEADLGIDSIKVAQMFGELRDKFGVRASDDVGLDDFPTLQHVIEYLLPN